MLDMMSIRTILITFSIARSHSKFHCEDPNIERWLNDFPINAYREDRTIDTLTSSHCHVTNSKESHTIVSCSNTTCYQLRLCTFVPSTLSHIASMNVEPHWFLLISILCMWAWMRVCVQPFRPSISITQSSNLVSKFFKPELIVSPAVGGNECGLRWTYLNSVSAIPSAILDWGILS